ncbi:MFS transporter [Streptomyces sp. NPDC055092]|uniref:MFS transporter n=1 Tax=Streptomyces sp. NPDC059262 TaxID=3346797 RepID=UPI0036D090FF
MSPSLAPSASSRAGGVRVAAVVGFLVLVELVSGMVQSMVPVLLPDIGKDLHVSTANLNWVSSLQLLSSAISVPLFGRLGDLYGHRRMLRVAALVITVGTILIAWSPGYPVLLLGRIFQGPFAALLPLEIGLVRDRLEGDSAKRGIALLVGALAFGATIGMIAPGLLSQVIDSVHGILWVPAGATLLCAVVVFTLVPESTTRARTTVDWPGAGLLSLGLAALLLAIAQGPRWGWGAPGVIGLFALSAAVLLAWSLVELRVENPIVDLRLSAGRNLLPVYIASFLLGAAMYGSQTAGTLFLAMPGDKLGYGFGYGTLAIGWMSLPSGLFTFLATTVVSRIGRALGLRGTLALGGGVLATGYVFLAFTHDQSWQVVVANSLMGFGTGLTLGTLPALVLDAAPAERTGIATGIYNTTKTLGGSVSGAVFGAIFAAITFAGTDIPTEQAFVVVWLCCAAVSLLTLIAAGVLRGGKAGGRAVTEAPATALAG